jgi:methylase of polypeptide subunit release factors
MEVSEQDKALVALLEALDARGYDFVTPTPATTGRIHARGETASSLRDALGWSLPFTRERVGGELFDLLSAGGGVEAAAGGYLKSRFRVSRVHGRLFLHSAYPTDDDDAVFLGPDTYRFADFVTAELAGEPARRSITDIGAGAGVGGVIAGLASPGAVLRLTDVNPRALHLAQVNAVHAGVAVDCVLTSGFDGLPRDLDIVTANPPYIAGVGGSLYQDGGDLHGGRLSLDWAKAAMERLAPDGRFLLYTGSAILNGGRDQLKGELEKAVAQAGFTMTYRELDPDVFHDDLVSPAYDDAERIAAVGVVIRRRGKANSA